MTHSVRLFIAFSLALIVVAAMSVAAQEAREPVAPPAVEPAGPASAAAPDAAAPAQGPEMTLLELFHKGGLLMYPITMCSIVGLAFVFERCASLRRRALLPRALFDKVEDLVNRGAPDEARKACHERPGPLSRLLGSVLLVANGSRTEMEDSLENEGARVLWELRRNGKVLAVVASVAPLLGLLGTVWGMIKAFSTFAFYSKMHGVPPTEMLAKGIYEALITTAAGLDVAIPALLFFYYFKGKADQLVHEMEEISLQVIQSVVRHVKPETPGGGAAE